MAKITFSMVKETYTMWKKFDNNEITMKTAIDEILKNTKMKKTCASFYFGNLRCLKEGKEYKRNMNPEATLYFFTQLIKDYDESVYEKSLLALNSHIDYYSYIVDSPSSVEKVYNVIKDDKTLFNKVKSYYEKNENNEYYPINNIENGTSRRKNLFKLEYAQSYLVEKKLWDDYKESIISNSPNGRETPSRGIIIYFLKDKNLLDDFIEKYWKRGDISKNIYQYCIYTCNNRKISFTITNEKGENNITLKESSSNSKTANLNDKKHKLNSINKKVILNKGFDIMLPVLPRFICNILQEKDRKNWWQKFVLNKLLPDAVRDLPKEGTYNELVNKLDISLCLKIIIANWKDIFKDIIKNIKHSWVHELIEIRNDVSHWTEEKSISYTFESISHTLYVMENFMRPIDDNTANQISELRREFEDKFENE